MSSEDSGLWKLGAETAREGYGLFIGNTLSTMILAIGSIIIARLLGSEGYGLYSLAFVIPSILVLFTGLGVDQALIKYVSEHLSRGSYSHIRSLFSASLLFKLSVGISAAALVYFFSDFLASTILNRPYMGYLLRVSCLLILFQALHTLCSSLFVGLGKASMVGALATFQAVVKVSLIISLLVLGFGIWGAVLGHVSGFMASSLVGLAAGFILLRRLSGDLPQDFPRMQMIKPLIRYGLPLYASTLFIVAVQQYNNLVLAKFVSNVEIGSYAAANNLSTIILLFAAPIATVLYPSFSRIESTRREDLPRVFELAVRYTVLLVVPAALFVSAFARELTEVIYGSGFQLAGGYLILLALLYSFYPILMVEFSYFNGVGFPRKTMISNFLIFLLVLPLSPLLGKSFRVYGVICALIIAYVAALIYATAFVKRKQGIIFGVSRMVRIYACAAASALASMALAGSISQNDFFSLIIGGAFFLASYMSLLGLLGALDERDYINLRGLLGRLKLVGVPASMALGYVKRVNQISKRFRSRVDR